MNLQLLHQLFKDNQFGKYRSMLRLLVLGHVLCLISATASGITHRPSDADKLQTNYGFGNLKAVNLDYGTFTKRAILRIQEDRYNPGSYFLMHLGFILKYTPGQPTTLFLGNPEQTEFKRYVSGNSSVAEFSAVSDIIQYNRTKYALSDYLNNCVREYDSDTDIVTPLVGDCIGDHRTSIGSLNPGDSVAGDSNFLTGVLDIELVESGNYFIMCDQGYEQITTYDVITGQVELLLSGQDLFSLPGPTSLLLNSDSTYLYVSHSNGLSKVNLDTRAVTLLVGESKFSIGGQVAALSTGTFDEATISPMNSLTWLVPDKVLLAASDTNHALVVMDLVKEIVLGSCVGSMELNTTQIGAQETCKLGNPKAVTIINHTIYVVADRDFKLSNLAGNSLFEIKLYERPCPLCPVQISVANLEEVNMNYGSYERRTFRFIVEDRYTPGQFYYNYGTTVQKLTPDGKVEHFLGKDYDDVATYSPGNSSTAEFSHVIDLVQYNETTYLLADHALSCLLRYDTVTDYVSQFIGKCNSYGSIPPNVGEVISASNSFLAGVIQITLLERRGYLLMIDGYKHITKYDFSTEKVELLGGNVEISLDSPRGMLANKDETELYVTESYKYLTRINLDTFEVTLLIGRMGDPFSTGKLSSADIDYAPILHWMVPDKLIVGAQIVKEALVFVDLEEGQIYSVCANLKNRTETITGDLSTCALNAPSAFTVTSDGSIYIATVLDVDNYYSNYSYAEGALYKIETKASICTYQSPTGNEIVDPVKTTFTQLQYVTVRCPAGMALNSSSNKRQCVDNSKWNKQLPHCVQVTSGDAISDLSPKVGQISGGTLVTAVGIIPDSGVEVHLNNSDGLVIPLDFKLIPQKLSFRMPNQSRVGSAELIIKLAENVTATYIFMYKEDPVLNYTVQSATIVSGGLDLVFSVTSINSSNDYTLAIPSINMNYSCAQRQNTLICDVKDLPADDNASNPRYLPIQLFSDGILMANSDNISLTVYADPVFKTSSISVVNDAILRLSGENLDVGPLNQYYNISILLKIGDVIDCDILKVDNATIECGLQSGDYSKVAEVYIYLGNLQISSANIVITTKPKQVLEVPTTHNIKKPDVTIGVISGVISAVTVITVIAVIATAIICYKRRASSAKRWESIRFQSYQLTKENSDWYFHINADLKAKLDPLLIKPDSLKLRDGSPIGGGNFGIVYSGQLFHDEVVKTVAVKVIKEMATPIPMIEKFLEEAVILQGFSHPNVLQTLGVCIPESDKPQVILPYMANGDLKSLIQIEHMEFSLGDLMHFAKQVACGMEYLSSNRFVHRDLAARNCLVDDKYFVKIADFGLSKDLYSSDYYKSGEKSEVALPIRWLAIESLRTGKFSTETDVWSYAVLMWELCTRGGQPYPDIDSWDIKPYLEDGRRLHTPAYCPPLVWEVMCTCWLENPEERPTFTMIHDFLSTLLENTESQPHGSYTYIRDYTKSIPNDYHVRQKVQVEMINEYFNLPKRKSSVSSGTESEDTTKNE